MVSQLGGSIKGLTALPSILLSFFFIIFFSLPHKALHGAKDKRIISEITDIIFIIFSTITAPYNSPTSIKSPFLERLMKQNLHLLQISENFCSFLHLLKILHFLKCASNINSRPHRKLQFKRLFLFSLETDAGSPEPEPKEPEPRAKEHESRAIKFKSAKVNAREGHFFLLLLRPCYFQASG